MNKKKLIIVIGLFIICVIAFYFFFIVPFVIERTAMVSSNFKKQAEQDCLRAGGEWHITTESEPQYIPGTSYCALKTHDYKKICKDSSECEGVCIAAGEKALEGVCAGEIYIPKNFIIYRCVMSNGAADCLLDDI